jgi:uncharacterized protein (TIGR02099 family)
LSSVAAAPPAVDRRRRRGLRLAWRVAFVLLFGAWSLLLLTWLVLQWGIVPRVGQWKPEIEARASAALGVPVAIGAVRVKSAGWMPLIELDDVVLAPRAGQAGDEALRLPRVHAALSARSLLGGAIRFEQLHVEGAALEVRRDAQGRFFVAGIEVRALADGGGRDDSGSDWLLAQHELVVRRGSVRWIDEASGAAPLELREVDAVLRNGLRRHELRLDATPPEASGARFTLMGRFTQPLLAPRADWRRWSGQVYVQLPHAEVTGLRDVLRHLPLGPAAIEAGAGALRAWVDVREGQAQAAIADVALRDVSLRFAGREKPLALARWQARLSGARDEGVLRLGAEGLSFSSGDIAWPATRLSLTLHERATPVAAAASAATGVSDFDGGEFSADRIDLAPLARLAASLPLGQPVHALLAELAPSGQLSEVAARWEGALDAPRRYGLKGRAKALAIAAAPPARGEPGGTLGRPGFRNADLEIEATEAGGQARLAIDKGTLTFPGVFEQPELALDSFATRLAWRVAARAGQPAAIEVTLAETRFANADVQGQLDAAVWRTGAGAMAGQRGGRYPGQLDLAGKLSRVRAAAVARYLPLGVAESARRYVERAVSEGRIANASFKVKGDLWDFPFAAAGAAAASAVGVTGTTSGEFRIAARVEGLSLDIVPADPGQAAEWPLLSRISGELVFDRGAMEIRDAHGRQGGLVVSKVAGGIRDLARPVLRIEGQIGGPLSEMLRFVNNSPVSGWTRGVLSEASAGGAGEMKLALELPFENLDGATVQGSLPLAGNDVRLGPGVPLLTAAKARIGFDHKGLAIAAGSARLLGGEATFEGGSQPDGAMRFNVQGVASAEGLRAAATQWGPAMRVFAATSGQTPYRLQLGFVRGLPEFTLTSPMSGLAIALPAPLTKAADTAWPLRVQTQVSAAGALRDAVNVELGSVIGARWQREANASGEMRVLRGAIGVNEPLPPLPERGVQAVLSLGAVDGDAWEQALQALGVDEAAGAAAQTAAPTADADGYLPRVVALRAQSLVSGGRRLTRLVAGVSQDIGDGAWRGNLDADQLGGYVEYRASRGAANPGRIHARLARLALPPSEASAVENLLAEVPDSVPALDIVIDSFELRGKKLGRVEIEAQHRAPREGAREAREWRMTRLAMTTPEAQLAGSGQWLPSEGGARRMVMDFALNLADSGAFLDRLGFAGTLRGGKGRLAGQLSWAGSPLALHLPSLDGNLNLALDSGQFLKAGPGAGRLLSVLSLQSLPRRLTLDFRDLFQEGFAFDNITGDIRIERGSAATRNLRMRGVQAVVLMEGSADLQRETQNLRVVVVPEINVGTASLAYAAINPAVGLGTFLAQMFLRRPLMAANTREFSVQGSWDEPRVERVERKFDAPLPEAIDGAASAAPPFKPPS